MRGISWLAAKTGQLLKKDSAPWSKYGIRLGEGGRHELVIVSIASSVRLQGRKHTPPVGLTQSHNCGIRGGCFGAPVAV
jgi:hypothetical protein